MCECVRQYKYTYIIYKQIENERLKLVIHPIITHFLFLLLFASVIRDVNFVH